MMGNCTALLIIFSNILFDTNQYRLPVNSYIILLPFKGLSFNWFLNYIVQGAGIFFGALFFFVYFPITLVFVDHTCWGLETANLLVENLDVVIEENSSDSISKDNFVNAHLKKIIEQTWKVMEWQKSVQELFQMNFLVDFTCASFLIGWCAYTGSKVRKLFFGFHRV